MAILPYRPILFACLLIVGFLNTTQAQSLTVISYNIRLDFSGDGPDNWTHRKKALAAELLSHQPDIIGLQEVLPQQLAYLDKKLKGYQRYGVGREDGHEKGEYCPIYFNKKRFQLLDAKTSWLSQTPNTPGKGWDAACERILTVLVLYDKQTQDTLWTANTHFDHMGQEARRNSVALVYNTLEPAMQKHIPVVITGDFNAEPDSEPVRLLKAHFEEICPSEKSVAGTFNGFDLKATHFKRIDYIWLSPGRWKVLDYQVPHPMVKGRHVSDHFPVVGKLEMKER